MVLILDGDWKGAAGADGPPESLLVRQGFVVGERAALRVRAGRVGGSDWLACTASQM